MFLPIYTQNLLKKHIIHRQSCHKWWFTLRDHYALQRTYGIIHNSYIHIFIKKITDVSKDLLIHPNH